MNATPPVSHRIRSFLLLDARLIIIMLLNQLKLIVNSQKLWFFFDHFNVLKMRTVFTQTHHTKEELYWSVKNWFGIKKNIQAFVKKRQNMKPRRDFPNLHCILSAVSATFNPDNSLRNYIVRVTNLWWKGKLQGRLLPVELGSGRKSGCRQSLFSSRQGFPMLDSNRVPYISRPK